MRGSQSGMTSEIAFVFGGVKYTGWTRAAVRWSAIEAARSFAFTMSSYDFPTNTHFRPDDREAMVLIDGEVVLTGFLDHYEPSFSGAEHKIEISGRSKAADILDSSVDHPTSEFKGRTLLAIARELSPQHVTVSSDVPLSAVPTFRVSPGEKIFTAIDRAVTKAGYFLQSTPDGGFKITTGSTRSVNSPLIEGGNILTAAGKFSSAERHSEVKVRGQRAIGSRIKGSLQIEGSSRHQGSMKRKRHRVVVGETDLTHKDAKHTAEWMQRRAIAESQKASIRVVGARDDNGKLWEANTQVYVRSPMLDVDEPLTIMAVSVTQDSAGTFTVLELAHPWAMAGPEAHAADHVHRRRAAASTNPAASPASGPAGYKPRDNNRQNIQRGVHSPAEPVDRKTFQPDSPLWGPGA